MGRTVSKGAIRLEIPGRAALWFTEKLYPAALDRAVALVGRRYKGKALYRYFDRRSFRMIPRVYRDGEVRLEHRQEIACPVGAWKAGRCAGSMVVLKFYHPYVELPQYLEDLRVGELARRRARLIKRINTLIAAVAHDE